MPFLKKSRNAIKMKEKSLKIYLIRHGQTVANTKGLVCGGMETPLTEQGRQEAQNLRNFILSKGFAFERNTRFFVSGLSRARHTLELTFPDIKNATCDLRLNEMDVGHAATLTTEEFFSAHPRILNHGLNPDLEYPNGESLSAFFARTHQWLESTVSDCISNDVENLVVVSHLGTMNCLLQKIFQVPIALFPAFKVGNATLTEILFKSSDQGYFPVLTMYGLR